MKVQMLTLMAGPDGVNPPGSIVDLPEDQANALIAGKYAVEVKKAARKPAAESVEIETASLKAPEKAVLRVMRKRSK